MRRFTGVFLAGALAAGCSSPSTFTFATLDEPNFPSITITVTDKTGLMADAGPAEPLGHLPVVENLPGQPDVVHLTWLRGACDLAVSVEVARLGNGLLITRTTRTQVGGCRGPGIVLALDLRMTSPTSAASIQVRDTDEIVP